MRDGMWSHSLHGERSHARKPEPLEGGMVYMGLTGRRETLQGAHTRKHSAGPGWMPALRRSSPAPRRTTFLFVQENF